MLRVARTARLIGLLAMACAGSNVLALEFRSVRAPGAVLFDAPSQSAGKLFILGAGYPVEIVVSVEGWHKVRDATGALAWVAVDRLSTERNVIINVPRAAIRGAASEDAPVVFEAEQGVLMKVLEVRPGWLKVRHRDGGTGFLRAAEVWGG